VNKPRTKVVMALSNLGTRLDNSQRKPLRINDRALSMVGPGDVRSSCRRKGLVCPTAAKAPSAPQSEFSELSNREGAA